MSIYAGLLCLTLAFGAPAFGQAGHPNQEPQGGSKSPLEARLVSFDLTDAILRDGLSELSLKNIKGLHLGFEEIIRDKIQDDPRALSSHFSLHLRDKSVRQIIDSLCDSDMRYTWSEDGGSINVYPRATTDDPSYFLNLQIEHIAIDKIPDPDQGLSSLLRLFPGQQIGYLGPGLGDNAYREPWTAAFEHLTVRQFINRIAEQMGSRTAWVWQGGKGERMFTFVKDGFRTREQAGQ